MKHKGIHTLKSESGFTLIEILVVIAIIAMLAIVAIPNINTGGKNHLNIAKGFIAKTFDDAYIHNRTNFLVIHLNKAEEEKDTDDEDETSELFNKRNGFSVVQINGKSFVRHKRRLLRFRQFPDSFKIEEVVLANNQVISDGYVVVPFYPRGFGEDIILHVLINGEKQLSLKIDKHIKEPGHVYEYITFEENEQ